MWRTCSSSGIPLTYLNVDSSVCHPRKCVEGAGLKVAGSSIEAGGVGDGPWTFYSPTFIGTMAIALSDEITHMRVIGDCRMGRKSQDRSFSSR